MTGFSNIGRAEGFAGIGADGAPEGDLTGSYPNPLVVGLWDRPIDPRNPLEGDSIIFTSGEWVPTPSPAAVTYFQGPWDANTNTPNLLTYPGLADGYVWIVTVPGNTFLGGIGDWHLGDYALYSGGTWYKLSNSAFGWGLAGNTGTQANVNYIGTTDDQDFVVRTNDLEVMRVYSGGSARLSGSLLVDNNITGSNAKLLGDLAVCGGDITSNAAVFNLLNGVTTRINVGNVGVCNWISGSTKFSQGLSGSLTKLTDGTSYMIASTGMIIQSASNGPITLSVNDSIFAALTGSVFSGVVKFNAGLSGSLTKLVDGSDYILGTTNTLVSTGANGSITISTPAAGADTQVQFNDGGTLLGANGGLTYNKSTNSLTVSGNEAVNGGNITTTATTFNLVNSSATTVNFAGGATSAINMGNTAATNSFYGKTKFPQGLSGSLTQLSDGTSYLVAGNNISITSASNGAVTTSFSAGGGTPANGDFLTFNGTTWVTTSPVQASAASYQAVLASEAIAAGDVCYIVNSGGSGAVPTVARAQANSLATIHGVIGLATGSIPKNAYGAVQTYGQLIGPVDTHLFGQGDPLYVSATTPGGLTNVKPPGPNYTFQMGVVTRQGQPQNVTTGIVFISPIMQTDTQNLSDLVITSPIDHDSLMYDPATLTWKNQQPLWIPETQTALTLSAGGTITAANFAGVVYLPIKTAGGANITLSATTPIANLTKTAADYGRELWLYNADNNRTITIPAGGTVKLSGGVNLVLSPGGFVKFLWTGLGGNGAWVQTGAAITVS